MHTMEIERRRWEIRPRDGQPPIRGDLRMRRGSTPSSVVLICHGFKGFREWGFFPALTQAVARHGHAAVSFDFSRNGVGEDGVDFSALPRFAENTHTRNLDEIRLVLDALYGPELLPAPPRKVGLFGHSRGGGEAILAAAQDGRVGALVTWAAIASVERWSEEQLATWRRGEIVYIANARTGEPMPMAPSYLADLEAHRERLDIRRAAAELTIPWLIVHGDADTSVSVDDARALWDAAGENAEMLLVEGADHTFGATHPFAGTTPTLQVAAEATLAWFDEHLD